VDYDLNSTIHKKLDGLICFQDPFQDPAGIKTSDTFRPKGLFFSFGLTGVFVQGWWFGCNVQMMHSRYICYAV
jgi:hypothetical protein